MRLSYQMESSESFPDFYAEAVLVERAQRGDRAAFEWLARRYRTALLAVTFARTDDREEAEDLVQEILVRAWQTLPTLREPAVFAAWLKAIAVNACRSWYRRSRPWPESLDQTPEPRLLPDPRQRPLEALLAREEQRAWRQALLTLPQANRVALLMHVWGGYSYEEIAAFLEVPLTTIEGRIYRAKMQMRRLLRSEAAGLIGEAPRRWQEKRKEMKTQKETKTDEAPQMDRSLALMLFTRQFATLFNGGGSLVRILSILEQSAPSPYAEYIMTDFRPKIEAGHAMSKEMGQRPDLFSSFYIKMLRIGEVGAIADETLRFLADMFEEEWKLARLARSGQEVGLLLPADRPLSQDWADLSSPQRKLTMMLFCRALSVLLSAGVPPRLLLETGAELLPVTQREAVRALAQSDPIQNAAALPLSNLKTRRGWGWAEPPRASQIPGLGEPLAKLGFLPPLVTQLMAVGEQSGQLDEMLETAARLYQHELQCELLRGKTEIAADQGF